mmetsp:Transcript_102105/g.277535  ORF Transcript_102105/g.277535 Transcript_102105/m.277535 type:complete len:413 (-) Transcript_102105:65-1303(-)
MHEQHVRRHDHNWPGLLPSRTLAASAPHAILSVLPFAAHPFLTTLKGYLKHESCIVTILAAVALRGFPQAPQRRCRAAHTTAGRPTRQQVARFQRPRTTNCSNSSVLQYPFPDLSLTMEAKPLRSAPNRASHPWLAARSLYSSSHSAACPSKPQNSAYRRRLAQGSLPLSLSSREPNAETISSVRQPRAASASRSSPVVQWARLPASLTIRAKSFAPTPASESQPWARLSALYCSLGFVPPPPSKPRRRAAAKRTNSSAASRPLPDESSARKRRATSTGRDWSLVSSSRRSASAKWPSPSSSSTIWKNFHGSTSSASSHPHAAYSPALAVAQALASPLNPVSLAYLRISQDPRTPEELVSSAPKSCIAISARSPRSVSRKCKSSSVQCSLPSASPTRAPKCSALRPWRASKP